MTAISANGFALTSLDASQITFGVLDIARLPSSIIGSNLNASTLMTGTLNNALLPNTITVQAIVANGAQLTNLNASQLSTGVLDIARLPASIIGSNLNASTLLTGTLNNALLPSTINVAYIIANGSALTNLNASQLVNGVLNASLLPLSVENASYLTSGVLNNSLLPQNIHVSSISADGSGLHNINATMITTGLLNTSLIPTTFPSQIGVGVPPRVQYAMDISGNVNLTGLLFQNDNQLVFSGCNINSQWVSASENHIYYIGNVGIDTYSPNYSLDVSGDINITGSIYKDGVLYSSLSNFGSSGSIVNQDYWTLYSTTLQLDDNTPLSVGDDGKLTCRYFWSGSMVIVEICMEIGTTNVELGSPLQGWKWTIPVIPATSSRNVQVGAALMRQNNGANFTGLVMSHPLNDNNNSSTVGIYRDLLSYSVASDTPFEWTSGDTLSMTLVYESSNISAPPNGDGSALVNLNASTLSSGTINTSLLPSTITVSAISANGFALTSLNASQLLSGTIGAAQLPAAISANFSGTGSNLDALNASALTTGTINTSLLPSTISVTAISANGFALTSLNASQLTFGTISAAMLPSSLSGAITGIGSNLTALNASAIATGTISNSCLPPTVVASAFIDYFGNKMLSSAQIVWINTSCEMQSTDGTQLYVGDGGYISSKMLWLGSFVTVDISIQIGSNANLGGLSWQWTLPQICNNSFVGTALMKDANGAYYTGITRPTSNNDAVSVNIDCFAYGISSNSPFTWENGDSLSMNMTYETSNIAINLPSGQASMQQSLSSGSIGIGMAPPTQMPSHSLVVSGFIGAGVTVPSVTLDISGDVRFTGTLYKNDLPFASSNVLWTPNSVPQLALAQQKIAFRARGSGTTTNALHLPISLIVYNYGNGYNASTSEFVAPTPGIYTFTATTGGIKTTNGCFAITLNNVPIARQSYVSGTEWTNISTTIELQTYDVVYFQNVNEVSTSCDSDATFSGVLCIS